MTFASSHKKRCHASKPAGRGDDGAARARRDQSNSLFGFGEKRCRRICFEDLLRECYDSPDRNNGNSTRLLWKILFEENEGGLGLWLQLEQNDPSAVLRMVNKRLQSARREESIKNQQKQTKSSENQHPPPAKPKSNNNSVPARSVSQQSQKPQASAPARSNHAREREPLSNSFHFELASAGFQF